MSFEEYVLTYETFPPKEQKFSPMGTKFFLPLREQMEGRNLIFYMDIQELLSLYAAHPQASAVASVLQGDKVRNLFTKGLSGSSAAMLIASLFTKGGGRFVCVLNDLLGRHAQSALCERVEQERNAHFGKLGFGQAVEQHEEDGGGGMFFSEERAKRLHEIFKQADKRARLSGSVGGRMR